MFAFVATLATATMATVFFNGRSTSTTGSSCWVLAAESFGFAFWALARSFLDHFYFSLFFFLFFLRCCFLVVAFAFLGVYNVLFGVVFSA